MHRLLTKLSSKKNLKQQIPVSLRTPRDEMLYLEAKLTGNTKPFLDEEWLQQWRYWVLIENKFPYSAAFKTHHLLIPKREVSKKDLTNNEQLELGRILDELSEQYDCYLVNFESKQSILHHYHVHLMTYKDQRNKLRI